MLNAFEIALHELVNAIGAKQLEPHLGIQQKYLSRMCNPHDDGAHFRARDLGRALSLGAKLLPGSPLPQAVLKALAAESGSAVYPLPRIAGPLPLVNSLARCSRVTGELGSQVISAIDPDGPGGSSITAYEFGCIQPVVINLAGHAAAVLHMSEKLMVQNV